MSNESSEIKGKVVDKLVTKPIPFAKVSIKETKLGATCDKNGKYIISEIPVGSYTVEANMTGYVNEKVDGVSISAGTTELNFSLLSLGFYDLKEWTPYYTKISVFISLLGFIIACLVTPRTEPKPYTRKVEVAVRAVELPPQLKQLEEPPPPPKPVMPVAAESDAEVEASTIDRTDFSGFEKVPPTPEASNIIDFWAVEEKPELLQQYYVRPEYPEIARKAGIEGQVVLELVIDTTGFVIDIKVIKSLHELLDEAAVRSASKWRFKPGRQRDKAVRVRVVQPVRFHLEE